MTRPARCGNDPRAGMAVEVEYAARLEGSVIVPRESQALAQRTVDGILSRGGEAALVSRTVIRSDWAEVDDDVPTRPVTGEDLAVLPVLDLADFRQWLIDNGGAMRLALDAADLSDAEVEARLAAAHAQAEQRKAGEEA